MVSHSALLTSGLRLGTGNELGFLGEFSYADRQLPGVEQFPSNSANHEGLRWVGLLTYTNSNLGLKGLRVRSQVAGRVHQSHFVDTQPIMPPAVDTLASVWGIESNALLTYFAPGGHRIHLRGGVVTDTGRVERVAAQKVDATRITSTALLADEWLLAGADLIVQAAMRFEHTPQFGATWIPRAGLAWEPNTGAFKLTVKGGVGRSYRQPSFDELYFDTGLIQGNKDLSPEDAWSFDGSVTMGYKNLSLEISAFHLAIDNLILFLPTTAFTVRASDAQGARTSGIEGALSVRSLGPFSLTARYTYQDARFRDSGRRLPGRSQHVWGGRLGFTRDRLTLWFQVDALGPFYMDRFEALREEGRVLLGLGCNVAVFQRLSAGLELRNLTNNRHAVDAMQQPLQGFSMSGFLRWRL